MVSFMDDGSKMVLCGRTTPHPLSSAQRNQQKRPFMHCVWVLNRVTWTWAHLNIMYLCNELELELFWTGGTNYRLSYFELDRSSSRSTLSNSWSQVSGACVVYYWFVPVIFLFLPVSVPSCCFASANANSLLTPRKGFRPHNTKQISIAAY